MYKQAPKQTYLYLFMFRGWCFQSQLVLRCTNNHQNKPIFCCLCLPGGAFTRILYFGAQTGTKTILFSVVKVYGMVLLLAFCSRCTNRHQNKPIFSCLCLRGGAFTRILYFGVQTGTKTSQFLVVKVYGMVLLLAPCPSMYKQAPNQTNFLVVYVYGVVLLLASCTSVYKQAPKQTYLAGVELFICVRLLLVEARTSVYK